MTALPSGNGRRPHTGTARLDASSTRRLVDLEAAESAARGLLVALDSPGLRDTPRRMDAAYGDMLTPEPFNFTSFPNEDHTTSSSWCATSRSSLSARTTSCRLTGAAHVGYGERREL